MWLNNKTVELQRAADYKDTKRFIDELKAVYYSRCNGMSPLYSADLKYAHYRS